MKFIAINCLIVDTVRICKSFTKHGMNNMTVSKLPNLRQFSGLLRPRRQLCSDDTWREKVLPQLTYCVSVRQSLLRLQTSVHSFMRGFMKCTVSWTQSHSLTVLTFCSHKSVNLHPCFMHIYVLKSVVLFHCLVSLNLKRLS
jgi:hypothetical protein